MKIDRIFSFNLLGDTLDEYLNWNSHINVTSMKIERSIGILYKIKIGVSGPLAPLSPSSTSHILDTSMGKQYLCS